ncbi:FHA domain-containing protein [Candidatus Micrarchaeota archaeon]|nr:FHA domain-containing protein [Candidatus Micrarchaeota archaeon]
MEKSRFPLKLVGIEGELKGKEIVLNREHSSIGTKKGFHIRLLKDRRIDAFHATIERREGPNGFAYSISPRDGLVFLNHDFIFDRRPLKYGDEIKVGRTKFVLQKHYQPEFTDQEVQDFFLKTAGTAHVWFPPALKKKIYSAWTVEKATGYFLPDRLKENEIAQAATAAETIVSALEKAGATGVGHKIVNSVMKKANEAITPSEAINALESLVPIAKQIPSIVNQSEAYTYSDLAKKYLDDQVKKLAAFPDQELDKTKTPPEIIKEIHARGVTPEIQTRSGEPTLVLTLPEITPRDMRAMKAEIGWEAEYPQYAARIATDTATDLFSSTLDARHFDWWLEHEKTTTKKGWSLVVSPRTNEGTRLLAKMRTTIPMEAGKHKEAAQAVMEAIAKQPVPLETSVQLLGEPRKPTLILNMPAVTYEHLKKAGWPAKEKEVNAHRDALTDLMADQVKSNLFTNAIDRSHFAAKIQIPSVIIGNSVSRQIILTPKTNEGEHLFEQLAKIIEEKARKRK